MAVKVISDLHGGFDAIPQEVSPDDTLFLLGDLLNFIDYLAMDGILVDVFGVESVREIIDLRAQRRFDEARSVIAKRREGREEEIASAMTELMRASYDQVRAVMPKTTYVISGNADSPHLLDEITGPGIHHPDGEVVEIGGARIGFVGGGLPTPMEIRGEISEDEFNIKIDSLGEVDILCTHIPPAIHELTLDTLAKRIERGSKHLLEYIRDVQPEKVLFGHIHQPLISSMHIGRTHLLNCGYFRKTRRAITLAL